VLQKEGIMGLSALIIDIEIVNLPGFSVENEWLIIK